MRREAARAIGAKPSAVRRLMAETADGANGAVPRLPLRGYKALEELVERRKRRAGQVSYLADRDTRRLVTKLATQANDALRTWQRGGRSHSFLQSYRRARLDLIVAMTERRTGLDWAGADAFLGA